MNPILEEIDKLYRPFEDTNMRYVAADYIQQLTDEAFEEFSRNEAEGNAARRNADEKLFAIIGSLSHDDLIEGYAQACRTLKGNIGGYMYMHFDEAYIPTMIQGIKDDDDTAYLFLGILEEHLDGDSFVPIVLEALAKEKHRTVDTALAMVEKLGLVEVTPLVMTLSENPNPNIARAARRILPQLQ